MRLNDFVGCSVTLYLEGGHVIKAKVADISYIETTDSCGRRVKYDTLVLILNNHTTMVRFDKVSAFEIY